MTGKAAGHVETSVALEAGATGVKVSAKGGAAARLSEALADLLSPFSSAVGFMGDRVSDARRAAAYRAAQKGVAMLRQEGIKVGNVPPKILLPWLEGASLETEGSESLEDLWAGLLARAVKSSDAAVVSYIDVLKRIGSAEAELLGFFATDTSPFFSRKFFDPQFIGGLGSPLLFKEAMLSRLDRLTDHNELADAMENLGLQSMCQVLFYAVTSDHPTTEYVPTKYYLDNEHAVSNLEHLGLIAIRSKEFVGTKRKYAVCWFQITKFAFDMLWACHGQMTGEKHKHSNAASRTDSKDR